RAPPRAKKTPHSRRALPLSPSGPPPPPQHLASRQLDSAVSVFCLPVSAVRADETQVAAFCSRCEVRLRPAAGTRDLLRQRCGKVARRCGGGGGGGRGGGGVAGVVWAPGA